MINVLVLAAFCGTASAQELGQGILARAWAEVQRSAAVARLAQWQALEEPDDRSWEGQDLPNFGNVSPGVYRSGQPTKKGLAQLKELGVKTVLNLKFFPGSDHEELARLGIVEARVPMSGQWAPSFEQMDRALAILSDPARRPILVHCTFGKDRTGFVVASYRVVVEGMPIARAVEEARSYHCCFFLFGSLKSYLERYVEHRRRLSGAPHPAR